MQSMASTTFYSLKDLHNKIQRGEDFIIELSVNASTYMEPDKYFLLKSSQSIQNIIILIQLLEPEVLDTCEIAYFDEEDEMIGEFKAREFTRFYDIKLEH